MPPLIDSNIVSGDFKTEKMIQAALDNKAVLAVSGINDGLSSLEEGYRVFIDRLKNFYASHLPADSAQKICDAVDNLMKSGRLSISKLDNLPEGISAEGALDIYNQRQVKFSEDIAAIQEFHAKNIQNLESHLEDITALKNQTLEDSKRFNPVALAKTVEKSYDQISKRFDTLCKNLQAAVPAEAVATFIPYLGHEKGLTTLAAFDKFGYNTYCDIKMSGHLYPQNSGCPVFGSHSEAAFKEALNEAKNVQIPKESIAI